MPKKSTRQKRILDLLVLKERIGVEDLAKILDVTSMTIRRDLAEMERKGELIRTHGGCALRSSLVPEFAFSERNDLQRSEKHAIARTVADLIDRNETVYLDTDMIAISLARLLPKDQGLRILTNNLRVAMELFQHKHRGELFDVIVLGGELAVKSPNLIGEVVPMRLTEFRLDVAILGVDAVDLEHGEFYKIDVEMAALARAAIARARRTLVLADHTKFGRYSLAVVGQFGPNVTLVTNRVIDPTDRETIEKTGANIVLAKE